jgi:cysteine desulfurase/selenocysteine lyase
MEHHANLIPWQQVCIQREAFLRVIPLNENGDLDLNKLGSLLDDRTRLVAITHISNVLGTVNPIEEIVKIAHRLDIPVAVDAAQSTGHYPVNVRQSDVDFLAFSAHKMFGPLGVGVLYAKPEFANEMVPTNYGGGSIRNVQFEKTDFREYPFSLEAGTANIAGVLGMGSAIEFIEQLDMNETMAHTVTLAEQLREGLAGLGGVTVIGKPKKTSGIVSFVVDGVHPHDVAGFLANENIAVRAGHHCAQPLLESMGLQGTVRASFSVYNTMDDVERTVRAVEGVKKFWL